MRFTIGRRRALGSIAVLLGVACARAEEPPYELDLVTVASLQGVGDSVLLSARLPAVDSRGSVAVLLHVPEGAVGLFDSTGAFRGRLGRPGTGPGEFRRAGSVGFGPGDSLWVIDRGYWAHLFDVHAMPRWVRTIQFPQPTTGQVTQDGFLSAGVVGASGLRNPHLADWDGQLIAAYGIHAPVRQMADRMQAVAAIDSTRIWTVREQEYALELLGSDGAKHREFVRRVPWFTATPDRDPAVGGIAPRVGALQLDSAGHLMVLIRRGNPARPPLARTAPSPMERAAPVGQADLAAVLEGVLEVLDPTDGSLLASRLVSGGALGFPAPDLLAEAVIDPQGNTTLLLKRIVLRHRK